MTRGWQSWGPGSIPGWSIKMVKIRIAALKDVNYIKKLVDSSKEMDVIEDTFSIAYYQRILKKGILLVAEENNRLVGVCFGAYNSKEKWADLLGLVVNQRFRNKGIGIALVKEFERMAKKKKLKTIDLYADKTQLNLFKKLNYKKGRAYAAFRKKLKW